MGTGIHLRAADNFNVQYAPPPPTPDLPHLHLRLATTPRFVRTPDRDSTEEDDDVGLSQSSTRSQIRCPDPKLVDLSTLTNEQRLVANAQLEKGQTLKVVAYAGTGKTVTLRAFAQTHPEFRILYVAVGATRLNTISTTEYFVGFPVNYRRLELPRQREGRRGSLDSSFALPPCPIFFSQLRFAAIPCCAVLARHPLVGVWRFCEQLGFGVVCRAGWGCVLQLSAHTALLLCLSVAC